MQFNDILGQDVLKKELIKQANSSRLHHAHMFVGKMGYGTLAVALAFVQYLFCENKKENDSCGQCPQCKKVGTLNHPDVHYTFPTFKDKQKSEELIPSFRNMVSEKKAIFDTNDWLSEHKEKNLKIRNVEIQEILNTFNTYSLEGGFRVQVIWMVEMLEKEINKILKILEEPNPDSLFILVAQSTDFILPTVLSRCNIHKLKKHQNETLSQYIQEMEPRISENKLRPILTFADGDQIAALRYLDDMEQEDSIENMVLSFLRGTVNFEKRPSKNINELIETALFVANQKREYQILFLEHLNHFFSELVVFKYTQTSSAQENYQKALQYFSAQVEVDQIEFAQQEIDKIYSIVDTPALSKFYFISLALKLCKAMSRKEFLIHHKYL